MKAKSSLNEFGNLMTKCNSKESIFLLAKKIKGNYLLQETLKSSKAIMKQIIHDLEKLMAVR